MKVNSIRRAFIILRDSVPHVRGWVALYVHGHLIGGVAETVLHFPGMDACTQKLGGVSVPEFVQMGFVR